MKTIFSLFLSVSLLYNCSAQTETQISINYNAITRGSSITLLAISSEITYSDSGTNKTIRLSKNQWKEIENLVSIIDLNNINNLEAPSSESSTDRALIASLSIQKGNSVYKSSTFDHGNPPKELKELINKLFEIIE